VVLSPPGSIASQYTLALPLIPASNSFMTLDTSGNMAGSIATSLGITGSNIANATINKTKLTALGQQVSSNCGAYSVNGPATSGSTSNLITNLQVTITTTGRPVMIMLLPGNQASLQASIGSSAGATIGLQLQNGSGDLAYWELNPQFNYGGSSTGFSVQYAPNFFYVDTSAPAGSNTYTMYALTGVQTTLKLYFCTLIAFEL